MESIGTELKSADATEAEIQEALSKKGEKKYRITHLFSATMPWQVERMAHKFLRAFCYISIGEPGGGKKEIEQRVELISEGAKK